jgi:hypothetical protein
VQLNMLLKYQALKYIVLSEKYPKILPGIQLHIDKWYALIHFVVMLETTMDRLRHIL